MAVRHRRRYRRGTHSLDVNYDLVKKEVDLTTYKAQKRLRGLVETVVETVFLFQDKSSIGLQRECRNGRKD